jgi:hypothetical protein
MALAIMSRWCLVVSVHQARWRRSGRSARGQLRGRGHVRPRRVRANVWTRGARWIPCRLAGKLQEGLGDQLQRWALNRRVDVAPAMGAKLPRDLADTGTCCRARRKYVATCCIRLSSSPSTSVSAAAHAWSSNPQRAAAVGKMRRLYSDWARATTPGRLLRGLSRSAA